MNRIIVLLDVTQEEAELGVKLMYLVTGAFWRALYDARAKKDTNELTMTYYGEVENNSGRFRISSFQLLQCLIHGYLS